MSYAQVKYYQEMGDYQAAYDLTTKDWKEHPEMKWPRNTTAWLLVQMMKTSSKVYALGQFKLCLERLKQLDIPANEVKLWGAVACQVSAFKNHAIEFLVKNRVVLKKCVDHLLSGKGDECMIDIRQC